MNPSKESVDAKSEAEKVAQDIAYRLVGMREIYRENVPQILGCIREPIEEILSKRDLRIAELEAEVERLKEELFDTGVGIAKLYMDYRALLARCKEAFENIINWNVVFQQPTRRTEEERLEELARDIRIIAKEALSALTEAGIGKETEGD